jgi:hypothetical protein
VALEVTNVVEEEFKVGDILIQRDDLGIPGLTLNEYVVCRPPYRKYGEMQVDCTGGHGGRVYSTAYPVRRLMRKTQERVDWLNEFHERQRAEWLAANPPAAAAEAA